VLNGIQVKDDNQIGEGFIKFSDNNVDGLKADYTSISIALIQLNIIQFKFLMRTHYQYLDTHKMRLYKNPVSPNPCA